MNLKVSKTIQKSEELLKKGRNKKNKKKIRKEKATKKH